MLRKIYKQVVSFFRIGMYARGRRDGIKFIDVRHTWTTYFRSYYRVLVWYERLFYSWKTRQFVNFNCCMCGWWRMKEL